MSILDSTRGRIGRREFLALGGGAFVVAAVPLAARRRDPVVRRTVPVMGTVAALAVVHRDPRRAHAALDAAVSELRRVERTMTRFTATSDVGRANALAAARAVPVGAETALVAAAALRWADLTLGAYDPAVGGAVALWDVTRRHAPPPEERVQRLAGRRLHRAVEVGESGGSPVLVYHDADASLDLGSIAKGYAVDRAAAALRDAGIASALVEVGGDLYALGAAPDGEPWRIGIQDPDDSRALAGTLDVADAAVATSGTYQQFFRYRGERFHHLLDPATAAPRRTSVRSLTIVADNCMHADVAATALYGLAPAEAARVLRASGAPGARVERTV